MDVWWTCGSGLRLYFIMMLSFILGDKYFVEKKKKEKEKNNSLKGWHRNPVGCASEYEDINLYTQKKKTKEEEKEDRKERTRVRLIYHLYA